MGEKILSLRSCSLGSLGALGPACCRVLSELSEEQAFHVSYLDIGMASWGVSQGLVGAGLEQVEGGDDDVNAPLPRATSPPNIASLLSLALQRN